MKRAARAVLLVDHGSRRPEANALLDSLARALRGRVDHTVEVAHLEAAEPTIAQGMDACVAAGAAEITVLPCFLAPGNHASEDVPRLVREAAARHRGVRVRVAEPIGTHPKLIEILLERLRDAEAG
jgi:sirohydrochlorin ferrochelatase